jgi:hypothetical protein
MSAKLTFNTIFATLAALSAAGMAACGGGSTPAAQSAVDAKEVPPALDNAKTGEASANGEATATKPAEPTEAASANGAAPAPDAKSATGATKSPAKKRAAGAKAGCGPGTCG